MTQSIKYTQSVMQHHRWDAWLSYHTDHPIIYQSILAELRKAHAAKRMASVKAIINYLRWHLFIEKSEDFKINDAYTGIYTHVIWDNHPELRTTIHRRELRAVYHTPRYIPV